MRIAPPCRLCLRCRGVPCLDGRRAENSSGIRCRLERIALVVPALLTLYLVRNPSTGTKYSGRSNDLKMENSTEIAPFPLDIERVQTGIGIGPDRAAARQCDARGKTPRLTKVRKRCARKSGIARVALPIEARAGIGLAARRDVSVAGNRLDRIARRQRARERGQRRVLGRLEGPLVGALELDADREIVAARSRPRKFDGPACQARASQDTNCTSSPSRRIRKWADTCRPRRFASNHGCASQSSRFWNSASIASPPNSPGGRLMLCTTSRVGGTPCAGRASWFGEGAWRAPLTQPSAPTRSVSLTTRRGWPSWSGAPRARDSRSTRRPPRSPRPWACGRRTRRSAPSARAARRAARPQAARAATEAWSAGTACRGAGGGAVAPGALLRLAQLAREPGTGEEQEDQQKKVTHRNQAIRPRNGAAAPRARSGCRHRRATARRTRRAPSARHRVRASRTAGARRGYRRT